MGGHGSAAWKDSDDRHIMDERTAQARAMQMVYLTQKLMRSGGVRYILSFAEYLEVLLCELLVRDHQDPDITFVLEMFRDPELTEDEPVALAAAFQQRLGPVHRSVHMPTQRVLCYLDALKLLMTDPDKPITWRPMRRPEELLRHFLLWGGPFEGLSDRS